MKINLLAALIAAWLGASYANAQEIDLASHVSFLDNAAAGETPVSLVGCDGDCGCCGHWVAGVEATYLKPDLKSGFEVPTIFGPLGVADPDDFESAPRIWLGWENGNGVGVRGRYWDFDADADTHEREVFFTPVPVFVDTSSSTLVDAYDLDLELTKHGCWGAWDMLASVGARHARLSERFDGDAQLFALTGNAFAASANLADEFEGTGITAALEGSRPLCRSGLSFYWNARGSVLWGQRRTVADIQGIFASGTTLQPFLDSFAEHDSDTLFIGELQAGLEWRRHIKCVCADVFARAVFEAQWWRLDNDVEVELEPFIDTDQNPEFPRASGDMDLFGMAFSFGVSR